MPEPSDQEQRSKAYARLRRLTWALNLVMTLGALTFLIASGIGRDFGYWVSTRITHWPLAVLGYAGALGAVWAAVSFPLDYWGGFILEHRFGMSTQTFRQWLIDYVKQLTIGAVMASILVLGLSFLLRAFPATWWAWAAAAWLVWSVLLTRLAPSLLIPIFYKQEPLKDQTLKTRLENLVAKCGTKIRGIFEINLSRTTKKANACLCGMGASRRVLVSDTLISSHPPEEVEIVLAHEVGHHELKHIRTMILISGAAAFLSCWGVNGIIRSLIPDLGLLTLWDLGTLPLVALSLMAVDLILMPLFKGTSRVLEAQADRYALEKTNDPAAFVATMKRLAELNLAEVRPPRWVEWLLYDHPSIARRIAMGEAWKQK